MNETYNKPRHESHPAYRAPEKLADQLQLISVDLINLHLVASRPTERGGSPTSNVVGRNFRDLHLQLDEIVNAAREFADDLAERMRAIYVTVEAAPTTADLLHGFLERLEQLAWMCDAENRVAESSIPRAVVA